MTKIKVRPADKPTLCAAFSLVFLGMVIASFFFFEVLALNVTPSVPVGIWCISNSKISRGDYVKIDVGNFAAFEQYRHYPFKTNARGTIPFLKQVGGIAGDLVETRNGQIYINNVLVKNSRVFEEDRSGRPLTPFPLPYVLQKNEVWLISDSPYGFDSRYLGFARLEACKKAIPLLVS